MSDLRHLTRLLNELQPSFLEITKSHGPKGSPTIEIEDYGKDHVVTSFPQMEVTASNNDPVTVSFSGLALTDSIVAPGTSYPPAPDQTYAPDELPSMFVMNRYSPDHASTLADSLVTVTATDTVTGLSSHASFNFIGPGADPSVASLPVPPGWTANSQTQAVFNQYEAVFGADPPSIQSLIEGTTPAMQPPAPVQQASASGPDPIHYIEGNMPIGTPGGFGGSWGHHR